MGSDAASAAGAEAADWTSDAALRVNKRAAAVRACARHQLKSLGVLTALFAPIITDVVAFEIFAPPLPIARY